MWNENMNEVEVSEETQMAVMIVELENIMGEKFKYATEVPSVNVFKQLYFPRVNRTIHGNFVGFSPDHIEYYIFKSNGIPVEDCKSMVGELLEQGWWEPTW